jgi:hypothetical protein
MVGFLSQLVQVIVRMQTTAGAPADHRFARIAAVFGVASILRCGLLQSRDRRLNIRNKL